MSALPLAFRVRQEGFVLSRERIVGDSTMARLIRAHDWASTFLGPAHGWSETLIGIVNMLLASPIPSTIYWGPQLVLIYNDAYLPVVGSRHPKALGKPGPEVWKEVWPLLAPQFERIFEAGEATRHDGVLIPIEVNGKLQDFYWNYTLSGLYENGAYAGIYNTATDVTAAALVAIERNSLSTRLNQVLQATSEGVVAVNRDWTFSYMNEAAQRASLPYTDMIGKNLWETLPHLNYEGSPNVFYYHRAMEQNEPGEFESFYPEPLNHWLHIQVRPAPDGIVLFFRDITGAKRSAVELDQAHAALADSVEELHWTIQLSGQIPWTASPNGAITSFSDRWVEFTGLTREMLLGDGWVNAIHPEDLASSGTAWTHSLATGDALDLEQRFRVASGEYRWLRSQATPRRDARGNIIKWYGTLEDVDNRKKAEEVLRTSEKLAAVGRLAASIAHEINNPLESVTNLLYLARTSEGLPPPVLDYLDSAERELRRASVITNQTLRFHKQSTRPTATHTAELIESGLSVYQGRLLNSNVAVERRLRAVRPILCFDGELRQVFNNLVANSIDAMHPGGGRLLLRTREGTHPVTGERGLVLTVADTGPGMPPEVRKKAFVPFFTTKGIGGTGLGLWVTQEIVVRHHGSLRLRSSQHGAHHGTVFTLFLPFDPAAAGGVQGDWFTRQQGEETNQAGARDSVDAPSGKG